MNNGIGKRLYYFPSIDSTNIMANRLASEGTPEGDVVIADTQTMGRGRLERSWQSPPGRNLYVSIVLRPQVPPTAAPQITLMAGVAVAEWLSRYCPGRVVIKWPNDILIDGKKICGILTEMKSVASTVDFVVLGIGVNINMAREDFEEALQATATSLKIETGTTLDRLTVAGNLFESIDKWYNIFIREGFPGIRDSFLAYTNMVGKQIRVVFRDDVQTGEAAGIDEEGTILMRDSRGVVQRITAGDVFIAK